MLHQNIGLLLLTVILRTHESQSIINRPTSSGTTNALNEHGNHYLNADRPLWMLEDSNLRHNELSEVTFTTLRPMRSIHSRGNVQLRRQRKPKPLRRRISKMPRRVRLPSHYVADTARKSYGLGRRISSKWLDEALYQKQQLVKKPAWSMPYFDNMPGQDSTDPMPVFVYNGPRGQLLLNTMLSTRRYPMQEPVPGQILYPPTAPIFRPKPIVQRFRVNGQSSPLSSTTSSMNLTLIPFYAHEAMINPRSLSFDTSHETYASTTLKTPPTVLYAAASDVVTVPVTDAGSAPGSAPATAPASTSRPSKQKLNKWQQYKVYRSLDEVGWRPMLAAQLPTSADGTTTPYPLSLASPLRNHRYDDFDTLDTTTRKPLSAYQSGAENENENFQILYLDDSLERPSTSDTMRTTTTVTPRHTTQSLRSSRYSISQEVYAFPVFTLGKLLKPERAREIQVVKEAPLRVAAIQEAQMQAEQDNSTDTWFILNSRYKGHPKQPNNKYHKRLSSKYISNTSAHIVATTTKPKNYDKSQHQQQEEKDEKEKKTRRYAKQFVHEA